MELLRTEESESYSVELHSLARMPQSYACFSQCYVNGVKFVVVDRDRKMKTQNSGVMVENDDLTYYGVVRNIVQLQYSNGMSVALFDCKWFDNDPKERGSTKKHYGLLSVDTSTSWYEDYPYCLAITARQIFYLEDLQAGEPWKVVNVVSHRGTYNDYALARQLGGPYQELHMSNDRNVNTSDDEAEVAQPMARRVLVFEEEAGDMFEAGEDEEEDEDDDETMVEDDENEEEGYMMEDDDE